MRKIFIPAFLITILIVENTDILAQTTGLIKCYADRDRDGFGNPNDFKIADASTGCFGSGLDYRADNGLDCDDTRADLNPKTWWYRDFDNDGLRHRTDSVQQCARPSGGYKLKSEFTLSTIGIKCINEENAFRFTFNNTYDCNDIVFHNINKSLKVWHLDNDQDKFISSPDKYVISCGQPSDGQNYFLSIPQIGIVGNSITLDCNNLPLKVDCNDNDGSVQIVQGWYFDADNDGFPNFNTPDFVQCLKPAGPYKTVSELVSLAEDCNDQDPQVFPKTWHEDKDGDGFTTGNTLFSCNQPTGYIDLAGVVPFIDCDDTDKRATLVQGWYADLDGDKHGGNSISACKPPAGYFMPSELLSINDCNDNDNKIYPNAPELCDGKDNNCNGQIDELACCPPGNILFVNAGATGANNGTSWANAFTKLQDGLELARRCPSVTVIWVAKGVYYPDEGYGITNNDRTATFTGRNNLLVLGGFAGNELLSSQRRMENIPETILNGDILKNGDFRASYNVVRLDGLDATFRLDGFTIINGNASSPADPLDYQRSGAGMLVLNGTPTINNCYFRGNTALRGSAIANLGGAALFTNCVISGNNRVSTTRGVVYNSNASPTFLNCTIAANNVGSDILYNDLNVSAKVYNCIIRGATPAISGPGSSLAIASIIQSSTVWPGAGNSNADPLFVNEAGRNLFLLPCSPAIDAANSFDLSPFTDILGIPRSTNGRGDIGAYEYNGVPKLYVNAAAAAGGNGAFWATAFRSLQDALQVDCNQIKEIWVARGTYTPTTNTNRDSSFVMRNNLAIYGGFTGTETQLSQRNWRTNETILSGDIGVSGNTTDNSFTVVQGNGLNISAILDGFTVSGGNANAIGTLDGVVHTMNGGGMHLQNASPTIINCTIINNIARANGGGIHNITGSPAIRNCIFSGNEAQWGGAIYNYVNSSPAITNSVFYGNRGSIQGGALFNNYTSNPIITNTTITGNFAGQGLAMANQFSSVPVITNSILWESNSLNHPINAPAPTITFSIVKEGFTGTGNLNADPLFIRPPSTGIGRLADLRLLSCSPAINAGNNAALPSGTTTDLAGMSRIALNTVDMGAYERHSIAAPQVIYVDETASGNNDGTSWANAYRTLQAAANDLNNCAAGSTPTINMAKGTYLITPELSVNFDKLAASLIGGFPNGGASTPDAVTNAVIIRGEVRVLKNATINGVRVER